MAQTFLWRSRQSGDLLSALNQLSSLCPDLCCVVFQASMTDHVEARSLSAINFVAANPPQYPTNPAGEKLESLTLYISRVPGTRGMYVAPPHLYSTCMLSAGADVILSTFKPQRKNVTGEDVANSLYYVHLDLPSYDHLAPTPAKDSRPPRLGVDGSASSNAILRKPVPGAAAVPALESHVSAQASIPVTVEREQDAWIPPGFRLENSPTLDSFGSLPAPWPRSPRGLPPQSNPIQRKPVGSQPRDFYDTPEREPPPVPQREMQAASPIRSSPVSPARRNPYYDDPAPAADPPPGMFNFRPSSPTKREASPKSVPFHLTLIRRDPSTGHQRNIGKISSFQLDTPVGDGGDPDVQPPPLSARGHPPINVRLDASGYAKFRGFPTRQSIGNHRPGSSTSLPHSMPKGSSDDVLAGFTRQVQMSYTKSWSSNIRQAFRPRDQSGSTERPASFDLDLPRFIGGHSRQDSVSSMVSRESVEGHEGRASPPLVVKPGPGLKPKGYFFMSPWDGLCDFRTGSSGRSLKCRHKLASNTSTYNPLVMAQNIRDGPVLGHGRQGSFSSTVAGAMPVSELRFNLPSAELFRKRDSQSAFDKLLRLGHRYDSSSDDNGHDPLALDVSLGKEAAGGGNKGKRAKLGKLIVHDEGLKMLDLVVACNMGIWWGAWERIL